MLGACCTMRLFESFGEIMAYSRTPLTSPVLSGVALRIVSRLMDTPLGQPVRKQTFAQLGVDRLRATDAPKGTGIGNPVLPGNYDEKPGVPLTMASDAVSAKHTPADGSPVSYHRGFSSSVSRW